MKRHTPFSGLFGALLVLAVGLAACRWPAPAPVAGPTDPVRVTPAFTPTLRPTARPTEARVCPTLTPELLQVEPVASSTEALSQIVTVTMGNLEVVTVTAESGTFTGRGSPARVAVKLLPDTVHALRVVARVRTLTGPDGCTYGGYTLETTHDRNGVPLIIVQGRPGTPAAPSGVIAPANFPQLQLLVTLVPKARLTTDFVFLSDAELLSVGYDDTLVGWSTATGQMARRIGEREGEALVVAASADGAWIATGGPADDPAVWLWDARTGEGKELGRHESYLTGLAFSPAGHRLASGSTDDTVQVWDVATGRQVATFAGDVAQSLQLFHSLYWADDDTLIAAGSDAIYTWQVNTRRMVQRLATPEEAGFFVDAAFALDGDRVAAVGQGDTVYVWNAQAHAWVPWPAEAGVQLAHVAFSPGGQLLLAATYEGRVFAWDAGSGQQLASPPLTTASIAAIRFSSSGRYLALGGWDSPISLWGLP